MATFLVFSANASAQAGQAEYWQPIDPYRITIDPGDPEIRELVLRWDQIGDELRSSTTPFAGTYEESGYRGWFLRWSPNRGFVFVYHSEGVSLIDFSYGQVAKTSDGLVLEPEREMNRSFRSIKLSTPRKWIPIRLSTGNYLVPQERIRAFGNYVGGFDEYNDFNGPCCDFSPFFFMATTPGEPARDPLLMVVPETYRRFMKRPINARIVSIGTKNYAQNYGLEGKLYSQLFPKASLTTVVISAGQRQGVKQNQLFRMIGEPRSQYLRILTVRTESARGVVVRDLDDDGKETYFADVPGIKEPQPKSLPAIRVGTKVTTSPVLDF